MSHVQSDGPMVANRWEGFGLLAVVLLSLGGILQVLQGLSAVVTDELPGAAREPAVDITADLWGWVHMVLGVVLVLAAAGLLVGAAWARVLAVGVAAVSAVSNFAWLPNAPIWGLITLGLTLAIIYTLTVHGDALTAPRE